MPIRARNSTIWPVAFNVRTASARWPCRAYHVGRPRGQVISTLALRCCTSVGRHRLAEADHLAQRADVDQEVVHRRLDVVDRIFGPGLHPLELDAEVHAVGRGLIGRVLDLQRFDEADVQLALLLVDEQPQEPLAVAVQPADGFFLPLAPLVPLAEIVEHLAAVAEHLLAGIVGVARQDLIGMPAAHDIGHAVAGGADGVGIGLGEDPRAGPDLPQLDFVDVGEGRRPGIDQGPAIGRAQIDDARGSGDLSPGSPKLAMSLISTRRSNMSQ